MGFFVLLVFEEFFCLSENFFCVRTLSLRIRREGQEKHRNSKSCQKNQRMAGHGKITLKVGDKDWEGKSFAIE